MSIEYMSIWMIHSLLDLLGLQCPVFVSCHMGDMCYFTLCYIL